MPRPIDGFAAQIDATIAQTARAIGSSVTTVRTRIRAGVYESYRDGKNRKVVVASVLAHRESAIAADAFKPIKPGAGPGRPRIHADRTLTAAERKQRWKARHRKQPLEPGAPPPRAGRPRQTEAHPPAPAE